MMSSYYIPKEQSQQALLFLKIWQYKVVFIRCYSLIVKWSAESDLTDDLIDHDADQT